MLIALIPLFGAMAVTLLLVPVCRALAPRLGMVAAPSADRWHEKPTPLLGGVAVYAGFIAGGLLTLFLRDRAISAATIAASGKPLGVSWPWIGVLLAASLMFAVGLADDRLKLNPTTKLMFQAVAAAILVSFGVVYPLTPWLTVNVLLTIFWFIALTNAMNLLDHMDGVAIGITAIAAIFLAITLYLDGAYVIAAASLALAGAALGFLPYNFPRASIFMGDGGSMFVGSLLAGLGAAYPSKASASVMSVLFVPAAIVIIPIIDTLFVTTTRTLAGRPISEGGRDHTSHRLAAMGLTERQVPLLLYAIAGAGGLTALILRGQPSAIGLTAGGIFLIVLLLLATYLARIQPYAPVASERGRVTLLVADLVHKRRALEVLMDLVLFAVAYQGAYVLRWDGRPPAEQEIVFATTLAVAVAAKSASFAFFGVYRGNWQHVTISDAQRIVKATLFGTVLTTVALVFFFREYHFGRGVLVMDGLLVGMLALAARASFRSLDLFRHSLRRDGTAALVYGAGRAGELAVREMIADATLGMRPVGFIDDDASKRGRLIHDVPVVGGAANIREAVQRHGVRRIVVAMRSPREESIALVTGVAADLGVELVRLHIGFEPFDAGGAILVPAQGSVPAVDGLVATGAIHPVAPAGHAGRK